MAGTDALVSKLVDTLDSTLAQQTIPVARFEEELQKLISTLKSIQDVLVDAERRQAQEDEAVVHVWLARLKLVAYDIGDALDELTYGFLKSINVPRKVWPSILLSASFYYNPRPRVWLAKFRDINERLDAVAAERNDFGFLLLGGVEGPYDWPSIARNCAVNVSGVRGRDGEKDELVKLLLGESGELQNPHLISILGVGGIGKTTLAKLVYNDEKVRAHFDRRVWVYVPEPRNKSRIARAVLESLIGCVSEIDEFPGIIAEIRRSIGGKTFLLILDDVWIADLNELKELEDCLIGCYSRSKILVTTRDENVVKLMGCRDKDIIRVGSLSFKECWSMFYKIAFHAQTCIEARQNLESIGVRIVARCKGLPLSVKIIAGLLLFRESIRGWKRVLESGLWNQPNIFHMLRLSYNDLSSTLKQCFFYCVTFPKGYRMSEDELITLWMAHGFLHPTEHRDMELVGHDYFHNLGMRSLLLDFKVEEKCNRYKTYCKMHDIVHDFAKSVGGTECIYIDVNSAQEFGRSLDYFSSYEVYHLHVKLREKLKFTDSNSLYAIHKLRSLSFLPTKKGSLTGPALSRLFGELTCLRSLNLSQCHLESIPSNINKLIHLRWLKLSKNYALKGLPKTICDLYNLQTLSVNWCDGLIHFPEGVEKLTNLRHLKNDYTYFLLPKGIGKLSGLRKLPRITVDPKFKDAFCLRDLKNLTSISGSLTIFFMERECDTVVEDAKQAQLQEKKQIASLSLNFPEMAAEEWMQQEDEELVEALKPPPSLEMLRITSSAGPNCPSWINTLTSLKKLKLWCWSNCKHLPPLSTLPCLEDVEFSNFGIVRKVSAEFYKMGDFVGPSSSTAPLFPKLKNLQFMNMNEWAEWSDYDGDEQVMPCLSYLSIENCPKMKTLPNFIRKKATLNKKIIR